MIRITWNIGRVALILLCGWLLLHSSEERARAARMTTSINNLGDNFRIAWPFVAWRHFPPSVNSYIIERALKGWAPTNVCSGPQAKKSMH